MQRRVLDGSMDYVTLRNIVTDSSIELPASLLRHLYDEMLRDVLQLQLQRQTDLQSSEVVKNVQLSRLLSVELDEINALLRIGRPMAFIVVAGRYADSDSFACGIASLLYYGDMAACLSEEQRCLLRMDFPNIDI